MLAMRPLRRMQIAVTVMMIGLLAAATADATRIRDVCEIQGARSHILKGIGLVVGLSGTGDKVPEAIRAQARMLDRLEIDVMNEDDLKSDNVAVVIVTAELPAFAKEGTRIDVEASSLYDCESLEGGILLETFLYAIDQAIGGLPYAIAQGPVSVGGFNADAAAGGAQLRMNHVTVGRVPMGAYIEREIPSTITDGRRVNLLLKRPNFTTASNLQEAIEEEFGPGAATAYGAGTVSVAIPEEWRSRFVPFVAQLQNIDVEVDTPARVVINERTGTIVVGGDVEVKLCQVAHGNLIISVEETPLAFQPLPFSEGRTVEGEVGNIEAEETEAHFMPIEGTSAGDIAAALNDLKVTPRDMIAIFQALREAGALEADLEIM